MSNDQRQFRNVALRIDESLFNIIEECNSFLTKYSNFIKIMKIRQVSAEEKIKLIETLDKLVIHLESKFRQTIDMRVDDIKYDFAEMKQILSRISEELKNNPQLELNFDK